MAASPLVAQGVLSLRGAAVAGLSLLLGACAQTGERPRGGSDSLGNTVASFDPRQIGKADIDRVADLHRREIFASVRVLYYQNRLEGYRLDRDEGIRPVLTSDHKALSRGGAFQ